MPNSSFEYDRTKAQELDEVLSQTGAWLEEAEYRGNDPYQIDSVITGVASKPLIGPLVGFARTVLKPYHSLIPKRFFTAAKPIMIPQALGDALSGEGYRSPDDLARKRARGLFQNLLSSRSPLSQNTAWGLPFAWGGTKATPPHWPTTITTSTVLSGILDAWHLLDEKDVLPEVESAIRFVFDDCGILETDQGPCILYGPGDTRPILNASAFAAGVFARVGEFLGRDDLMNFAQDALLTIVRYQNDDGSWYYAPPHGEHALDDIIDNRHTGYVLEGLAEGNNLLKNEEIASSIERGWRYLEENLIDDGKPRWSPEQTWPIDSSDVSQSILTAVSVNKMEFAGEFANFALDKFYMGDGRFRYKVFEDGRSNDSVFIRWTQAPMYKALSKFRAKV